MKKMKAAILVIALVFAIASTSVAGFTTEKNENTILLTVNKVVEKVNKFENTSVVVKKYYDLYDVEMNVSYLMIELENGYIIASKEHGVISEYNLSENVSPYSEFSDKEILIYGGPDTYYGIEKESKNDMLLELSEDTSFVEKNREFLSLTDESRALPEDYNDGSSGFVGIKTDYFSRYQGTLWSNYGYTGWDQDGICGTLSVSVLLAHYDDYRNVNIVPDSIRTKDSSTPGSLVSTIYNYADRLNPNGTTESDLVGAINSFLRVYSPSLTTSHRPLTSVGTTSTFTGIKSILASTAPKPIILLFLTSQGFPGSDNHWSVVYQYQDASGTANDLYKCNNVNGSYIATYNVLWASTMDYLYLAS